MADSYQLKAILSAVDKITPTLKGVRRGLGMTQKSFRDLGGAARGIVGSLGLAGILSFSAIGFGALRAASNALEYAGALNDARDSTGMALKPMQELQTVFEAGGVSGEDFLQSVTKLNKGLADAAAGKDDGLAGLMTKLRIPLRNAKGEIRSVEEVLPELADAFKKNENPAVRTRMAMELFGKAGAKMTAILQAGGAAMLAARAEAQRLGTVLSDDAAGNLDDLGDSIGILNRQVKVQMAEAFGVAAPSIMAATKGLQEWIASNKGMLQQNIGGYISLIAQKFQTWVESGGIERLATGIMRVVDGIGVFIGAVGGLENVLIGIGALMIVGPAASAVQLAAVLLRMGTYVLPLLGTALNVVATAFMFVGRMMLANPIMLVIAAIAGSAYLIYRNWGTVSSWFAGLWQTIGNLFAAGMGLLRNVFLNFSPLGLIIKNWEPIVSWFSGMWDRVKAFIEPVMAGARAVGGLFGTADMSPVAAGGRVLAAPAAATGSATPGGGLAAQASANVRGELRVRFEGAPPGTRVDPGRTNQPGMSINPDVGYRNSVMG